MGRKIDISQTKDALFWEDLKGRIDEYFSFDESKKKGNYKIYIKTIFLFILAGAHYYFLVIYPTFWVIKFFLCITFGINIAFIGFNVMHDGAHGSYSNKKWVNKMMGYVLNLIGGNAYLWKVKHNRNHHFFTNVEGMDDDIDIKPWIRTNENEELYWYHKYQHIYCFPLYGLTYFLWVFVQDFKKYWTSKVASVPFKKMNVKEHFIFWISKIIYVGIFIAVPIITIGWLQTIIGYIVFSFFCGLVIAIVFQLAHVVPDTIFEVATAKRGHEFNLGPHLHQLATTVDFATNNKIISWSVGGLNYQVEHHLFPDISHIHYPNVRKILLEVCDKFKVKHLEYITFISALGAHIRHLKEVGSKE